ncbi:MAG: hypothetical protein QF561_01365 [Phycisphaerales bacterium]|jgi:ATP-dependent protease HslVU (ClpYQ) peptidase subunit|nr:hypothetical protein [Phycisphaerales bacterium]
MSIVAAIRRNGKITMGADTLALFGEGMTIPETNACAEKIVKIGDAVVGGTGWAVYDDILAHHVRQSGPPRLDSRAAVYDFFLRFWRALRETYSLVNEQAATKETPFGDLDATFLIASPGGLFNVSSDLGVTEFHECHAIGSGAEYALGAMHAMRDTDLDDETLIRNACGAAVAMDTACGGTIQTLTVECTTA